MFLKVNFLKVNFLIRFFDYKMTVDLPFSPTGITYFEFPYSYNGEIGTLVGKVEEVVCVPNIVNPELNIILSINYNLNNKSDVRALSDVIKKINSDKNKKRIGKWERSVILT